MDIYAQNVMDHYKNPHNVGELADPTVRHQEVNTSCGDKISVDLQIENNILINLKIQAEGCSISQAAISILSDEVKQKTLEEILSFTEDDIKNMLGVPVSYRRTKCALLGLLTIKNAILIHQKKSLLKWYDIVQEV